MADLKDGDVFKLKEGVNEDSMSRAAEGFENKFSVTNYNYSQRALEVISNAKLPKIAEILSGLHKAKLKNVVTLKDSEPITFDPMLPNRSITARSIAEDLCDEKKSISMLARLEKFRKILNNKEKDIFSNFCELEVPLPRALWYIKMIIQIKKPRSKEKVASSSSSSKPWDATWKEYLESKIKGIDKVLPSEQTMKEFQYGVRLTSALLQEGMADKEEWLLWLVKNLEPASSWASVGVFLPIICDHIPWFENSSRCAKLLYAELGRRYASLEDVRRGLEDDLILNKEASLPLVAKFGDIFGVLRQRLVSSFPHIQPTDELYLCEESDLALDLRFACKYESYVHQSLNQREANRSGGPVTNDQSLLVSSISDVFTSPNTDALDWSNFKVSRKIDDNSLSSLIIALGQFPFDFGTAPSHLTASASASVVSSSSSSTLPAMTSTTYNTLLTKVCSVIDFKSIYHLCRWAMADAHKASSCVFDASSPRKSSFEESGPANIYPALYVVVALLKDLSLILPPLNLGNVLYDIILSPGFECFNVEALAWFCTELCRLGLCTFDQLSRRVVCHGAAHLKTERSSLWNLLCNVSLPVDDISNRNVRRELVYGHGSAALCRHQAEEVSMLLKYNALCSYYLERCGPSPSTNGGESIWAVADALLPDWLVPEAWDEDTFISKFLEDKKGFTQSTFLKELEGLPCFIQADVAAYVEDGVRDILGLASPTAHLLSLPQYSLVLSIMAACRDVHRAVRFVVWSLERPLPRSFLPQAVEFLRRYIVLLLVDSPLLKMASSNLMPLLNVDQPFDSTEDSAIYWFLFDLHTLNGENVYSLGKPFVAPVELDAKKKPTISLEKDKKFQSFMNLSAAYQSKADPYLTSLKTHADLGVFFGQLCTIACGKDEGLLKGINTSTWPADAVDVFKKISNSLGVRLLTGRVLVSSLLSAPTFKADLHETVVKMFRMFILQLVKQMVLPIDEFIYYLSNHASSVSDGAKTFASMVLQELLVNLFLENGQDIIDVGDLFAVAVKYIRFAGRKAKFVTEALMGELLRLPFLLNEKISVLNEEDLILDLHEAFGNACSKRGVVFPQILSKLSESDLPKEEVCRRAVSGAFETLNEGTLLLCFVQIHLCFKEWLVTNDTPLTIISRHFIDSLLQHYDNGPAHKVALALLSLCHETIRGRVGETIVKAICSPRDKAWWSVPLASLLSSNSAAPLSPPSSPLGEWRLLCATLDYLRVCLRNQDVALLTSMVRLAGRDLRPDVPSDSSELVSIMYTLSLRIDILSCLSRYLRVSEPSSTGAGKASFEGTDKELVQELCKLLVFVHGSIHPMSASIEEKILGLFAHLLDDVNLKALGFFEALPGPLYAKCERLSRTTVSVMAPLVTWEKEEKCLPSCPSMCNKSCFKRRLHSQTTDDLSGREMSVPLHDLFEGFNNPAPLKWEWLGAQRMDPVYGYPYLKHLELVRKGWKGEELSFFVYEGNSFGPSSSSFSHAHKLTVASSSSSSSSIPRGSSSYQNNNNGQTLKRPHGGDDPSSKFPKIDE